MGMFGSSKPRVDPELEAQKKAEQEKLAAEKAAEKRRLDELERMRRANLLGAKSLQSEELEGYTGFVKPPSLATTKKMGTFNANE